MTDEKSEGGVSKSIGAVTDLVKAVPVYQDAIQPAAKELGKGLTTVAKAINLALAPLTALVWGYEQIKEFVERRVAEKLRHVPTDRIASPSPHVAGPALEALRFTGHNDELRNLFANLLASSIDSATAANAHPAFVDVIKSMTPDEARMMRALATVGDGQRPVISLLSRSATDRTYGVAARNFCLLAEEANCEHGDLVGPYVDNLCRLGLVEISDWSFSDIARYEPLQQSPRLTELKNQIEQGGSRIDFSRKILMLTDFGFQFCAACVIDHDDLVKTPSSDGA